MTKSTCESINEIGDKRRQCRYPRKPVSSSSFSSVSPQPSRSNLLVRRSTKRDKHVPNSIRDPRTHGLSTSNRCSGHPISGVSIPRHYSARHCYRDRPSKMNVRRHSSAHTRSTRIVAEGCTISGSLLTSGEIRCDDVSIPRYQFALMPK